MSRRKIGRNDLCPCGSGKKYKKCHGSSIHFGSKKKLTTPPNIPPHILQTLQKQLSKQRREVQEQGLGNPILSIKHKDYQLIGVGNKLRASKKWKTFHDFLFDYLPITIGGDWGNSEIKKPLEERHPILQWYNDLCNFQRAHTEQENGIYSAFATGSVMAYLALAYDLYTIEHNSKLQKELIHRLKNKIGFQGARYEIYATAAFIRAGYDIDFEDENDPSRTHCEFTAISRITGKKFSLEAKSRHRPGYLGQDGESLNLDDINLRIGNLLYKALKKQADHERIIFIDINMPPEGKDVFKTSWFKKLINQLDIEENKLIDGKSPPSAYVFFTNHPYHYVGYNDVEPGKSCLMTGFNIPDFKINNQKLVCRKYPDVIRLFDSMITHTNVPHEI